VPDIGTSNDAQNEVFDLVHRQCIASGIRLAPPPNAPVTLSPKAIKPDAIETPQTLLDHLAIFAPLTEDERAALAAKMRQRTCRVGETVVEAGSALHALFIIRSGVLVASRKEGERDVETMRLGPGEYFGETGVLTGDVAPSKIVTLTRAVLYEISKDDLGPILKERPAIATELGQILARREATARQRLERRADQGHQQQDLAEVLAMRVKNLFRLT
jgi:CRP-like cAMP-binding protein